MKTAQTRSPRLFLVVMMAAGALVPAPARAADDLLLSEFMAENDGTVQDEDGDTPDWLEIYNAGTNTVNLNGWYLTDNAGSLTKWRFPNTNLSVNASMLIYASDKDRRTVGRPLHTNFKLDNDTGYIALVKPDGTTIQSLFNGYPQQVAGVSYGLPVTLSVATLISNGSPARFTVPVNNVLGATWIAPGFNDGSWVAVTNGVGFEGGPAPTAVGVQLADATGEFSGTQGGNNWFYGYWDKKADANGTYEAGDFTPFPRGTGNIPAATNYWDGTRWDWPAGNPPWTELTSTGGHPAGDNGNAALPVHWAIRRYVSETNGPLRLTGLLACSGTGGTCGDGTVGHIFVDGVEVWQRAALNLSVGYSVIVNASLGSTIDFAIDPGAAANDFCDTTTFTAAVRQAGDTAVVADTQSDWSDRGVQGQGGWTYGYFIKTNAGLVYTANRFVAFPSGTGPHSTANFWNGESWQWFDGDPPFDTLGQVVCRPSIFPSGTTNGLEHWIIRRWVSEISGAISIDWHFAKKDLTGAGTTARFFHNGTQRDTVALAAGDFAGATRFIPAFNVQAGDAIDFTVEPGADIAGDICFLNATIHGSTTLSNQFNTDVGALMTNINASAYLRIPFTASNAAAFGTLTLRMKYNDGFIAWLNGSAVVGRNAPDPTNFNSAATASRPDALASQFEDIDLTQVRSFVLSGDNVLAIQGLNRSATDPDFLIAAELRATTAILDPSNRNYFASPTPGTVNGAGTPDLGPLVTDVKHTPHDPADTEDLYVTALAAPTLHPLATVRLYYRVQFGSESNIVMLDDGLHADGLAGDGVFGAVIPNTVSGPGQMVRYYITATSTNGALTRQPPFPNASFSAQYFGAVVQNPTLTNPLPVLHLFITEANLATANANGTARTPCSLYWLGEFYDNLGINQHGQSSSGFPKKSYDIDFNADHHFKWAANEPRVDDINLLTTYPDKAHMRNHLAYGICKDAGSPYHYVVSVRMQTNGGFYGDWNIVENGDANYLKRLGRDPDGALYKMYNTFNDAATDVLISSTEAEKKTRKYEGNADLVALFNGVQTGSAADQVRYMYDNINVPEVINTMAARSVTSDWDCCHKNYYFYRDSNGTGEWEAMPWDLDLCFGRNWSSTQSYWDDAVYPNNRIWGNWDNNAFFQLVLNMPTSRGINATRQMYLRRVRTLMDELMQTNGTPASQLHFEKQIDGLVPLIAPDAELDLAKWGTWGGGTANFAVSNASSAPYWRTLPQSVAEMKTNYLFNRRKYVFDQKMGLPAEFPDAQPTNLTILIGAIDYSPASGNQAQEYIQLINTNTIAVDISGWKLSGAVEHTFQGGVVIPAAGSSNMVFVVPDKKAFRARTTGPRGGQSLLIEGAYKGQLSARGETIILSDKTGRLVRTNAYPGNPSGPQQWLRITEIMYHPPAAPAGSPYEAEDFEYIELRNTGPTNISLAGVHFTNGVEFTFSGSLDPGAYTVVVRNLAAFTSRYGSSLNVAGAYIGILDNGGENLHLDDAVGEQILDFSYDNDWYPITDGPGASLVIVEATADWRTWDLPSSWRPSAYDFGSPAGTEPPTNSWLPVVVNELLTHSDPPLVDAVELLNPNPVPAPIGGWFLSDDFAAPKKYRVPGGTVIPAGGLLVIDETLFNSTPGVPPSFALSSLGDEVFLFSGNGTNLTGWFDGQAFGATESGVSLGRYTNSQGDVHFVAQSSTTFSNHNALPKVGPAVVSEIHYHPPDLPIVGDNDQDEFIELSNISGAPLPLFDPANPTHTWRLRSAIDFDFPTNVTLPSGGFAMIVGFNPTNTPVLDAFRARFGVPAIVPVFGPWSGKLDNSADSVKLEKPDAVIAGQVPYVLVESIDYNHTTPWPPAADGLSGSLQRLVSGAYGNDPTNWIGAAPTGGSAFVPGGSPGIALQPASVSLLKGFTAMFSVTATGSPPFAYQWQLNSINIPGANSSLLLLPNVDYAQAGVYRVIVLGAGGSTVSSNALLTVLVPASITLHPVDAAPRVRPDPGIGNPLDVAPNTNATFTAAATSSNPPLNYQWRMNGTNLLPSTKFIGPNSTTLIVSNVTISDFGDYSCAITDGNGTIFSSNATLYPLVRPTILIHPATQTVPAFGAVPASVVLSNGFPPPFRYIWYRGSTPFVTNISDSKTNFTIIPGVIVSNLNSAYTVRLTNRALTSPAGANSANFNLTVIADSDFDGMPDSFELIYSGTTNTFAPSLDADGDGMSNLAEYLAGTDPASTNSYLRIDQSITPGTATVNFAAVSNRTYTIQFSDVIPGVNWQKLADVISQPSNRVEVFIDPGWTSKRFYRAVIPRQP